MAAARGLDYSKWDKLEVPDEAEDDTCASQPAGKSNSNATLCRNCRMVPQKQLLMMILFSCSLWRQLVCARYKAATCCAPRTAR